MCVCDKHLICAHTCLHICTHIHIYIYTLVIKTYQNLTILDTIYRERERHANLFTSGTIYI